MTYLDYKEWAIVLEVAFAKAGLDLEYLLRLTLKSLVGIFTKFHD